jgi:hypothetical protein
MKYHFLAALALTALIAGCTKDDPAAEDTHVHHHGTIKVSYTFVNDTLPFSLDSTVTDSLGRKVRFNVARFLTSGYILQDDAHLTVGDYRTSYILADAAVANNSFELGEMEAGHSHSLMFDLGLDSATNHSDPTLYTTAPLNDPTMHWSWNPAAGYKFLALEGRVDANGDGVVDATDPAFTYHCATDVLRTTAAVDAHNDLAEGETFTIAMTVDMATLLSGVDVAGNLTAMGATPVNQRLMQNLAASLATE